MKNYFYQQLFPILLAAITFLFVTFLLFLFIRLLNSFPLQNKIILSLRPLDVLVGFTIYIKTAIDFALFIGNLMHKHPGTKSRIAIEIGTALGNGIGTLVILSIWVVFKEVPVLLAIMILLASMVLLRMAESGLRDYFESPRLTSWNYFLSNAMRILALVNKVSDPFLGKLLPRHTDENRPFSTFWPLLLFALTIPFLLGLDDFAGYIPLFSIINVFGFATGVFLGHMVLTASLFAAPNKTTKFVRQPIILVLGSFVFVGLSLWGMIEVVGTIFKLFK